MNHLIDKLKYLFTAMAYAEEGDLDAVKQVLRDESDKLEFDERTAKSCSGQPVAPAM